MNLNISKPDIESPRKLPKQVLRKGAGLTHAMPASPARSMEAGHE